MLNRLLSTLAIVIILPLLYVGLFAGRELTLLASMDYRRIYDFLQIDESNSVEATRIPKILHRMWKNNDLLSLPPRWRLAYYQCQALHSKWEIKLWTDNSMRAFIANNYPGFLIHYDNYPYNIQRVDAARYFILLQYGGVYMDMDISCERSLDPLLSSLEESNQTDLLPKTDMGFSNDFMIAAPNSTLMQTLVKELEKSNRFYGLPYLNVLLSTGSSFLSLVYDRMPKDQRNAITILDPDLYGKSKDRRFVRHLDGGSWHGIDAAILQSTLRLISRVAQWIRLK